MRTTSVPITLAMMLLLSTPGMSQKKTDKADVQWGPDMRVKSDGEFRSVIGSSGNSSFLLMLQKKERLLQRMDGTRMVWQKPISMQKDMTIERIALVNDDILVLASLYDKKANENQLYYSRYDQAQGRTMKEAERISTIPADKSTNAGGFSVRVSPGRSKVLVHLYYPSEKGQLRKTLMEMYDGDMQLLWSQDMVLPYTAEEFSVESQWVDDDGSVVMLGMKYAQKAEKRELKRANKATYEYHLLTFNGKSAAPEDHRIEVADKFLQDMTISMGTEGDILCAGLYGNKGTFSVRGAFFLRLDRTSKQIVHESYKSFSDDFITSYMTEKQVAKAEKKAARKNEELELAEFQLHDIIRRDDGGAVLLAEQYYTYTTTSTMSTGNGGYTTVTTYHYVHNDILAVNINPQGDIEWAVKVPKRQHTTNTDAWSGFAVNVKEDKIYLVFNDTGENLFLRPGDTVKQFDLTGKNALAVLATIDAGGNVSREALFSPERRDVVLRPEDCEGLDDKSMFIYASRKSDYRFGLITFR